MIRLCLDKGDCAPLRATASGCQGRRPERFLASRDPARSLPLSATPRQGKRAPLDRPDNHFLLSRYKLADARSARREARIARWSRPLNGVADRLSAWAHMIFADHGAFRFVYLNHHQV